MPEMVSEYKDSLSLEGSNPGNRYSPRYGSHVIIIVKNIYFSIQFIIMLVQGKKCYLCRNSMQTVQNEYSKYMKLQLWKFSLLIYMINFAI